MDVDFNYLQAFEQVCRDEFQPLKDVIHSEEFKAELKIFNGIFTQSFCSAMFDTCFKRSFNVEYIFNTDMKEFSSKYKHQKDA